MAGTVEGRNKSAFSEKGVADRIEDYRGMTLMSR